jgi:hypothetical protein
MIWIAAWSAFYFSQMGAGIDASQAGIDLGQTMRQTTRSNLFKEYEP